MGGLGWHVEGAQQDGGTSHQVHREIEQGCESLAQQKFHNRTTLCINAGCRLVRKQLFRKGPISPSGQETDQVSSVRLR